MTSPCGQGTAGLHILGLPALFVRSDVFARGQPDVWDDPSDTSYPEPSLEAPATIVHELRHFHDSLTSPHLRLLCFAEAERCLVWQAMVAAVVLDTAAEARDRLAQLVADHRANVRGIDDLIQEWGAPFIAGGVAVSLRDLLELLGTLAELAWLRSSTHDRLFDRLAVDIIQQRRSLATVFEHASVDRDRPPTPGQLRVLYRAAIRALADAVSPTAALADHLERAAGAASPDDVATAESVRVAFMESQDSRPSFEFETIDPGPGGGAPPGAPTVSTWIDEADAVARMYVTSDFELFAYSARARVAMAPATVIYPTEEMVARHTYPFGRRRELAARYGGCWPMSEERDAERRTTYGLATFPTLHRDLFAPHDSLLSALVAHQAASEIFGRPNDLPLAIQRHLDLLQPVGAAPLLDLIEALGV